MRMTLVLLAILLPSVSAAADCGFVLWAEYTFVRLESGGESVSWTLIQTASSLAQCEAAMQGKIESVAENLRKSDYRTTVEVTGNIVAKHFKDGGFSASEMTRYLCVPDRIDPRPKGR